MVFSTQQPVATVAQYGGIVIDYRALSASYGDQLRAAGVDIYPYLENSPTAAWDRDLGHVAAIITNKPGGSTGLVTYRATSPACA